MNDMIRTSLLSMAAVSALVAVSGSVVAQTSSCPEQPNKVVVSVVPTITFDAMTGLYTYRYVLNNERTSTQEVDSFNLDFDDLISAVRSPRGWTHGFFLSRSTIGWDASEVDDNAPRTAGIPKSVVQIKPGASLSGFEFKSAKSPGATLFYVTGYVQTPIVASELEAEVLFNKCPEANKHILDQAVVGVTQGPSDALAAKIDIKPDDSNNAVNPRNNGVIPVALLGGADFDVTLVVEPSVKFGPGRVGPLNGKGHHEDVNNDGWMDLVFQFSTEGSGLRCFDRSMVLTGQRTDGKRFIGVDAVNTMGCGAGP